MSENITTVPNLPEAGDPSLSDLLYLVQGEGSDRDRKVTLERLRDFVQSVFGKITCTGLTVANGGTLTLTVHDSQAGDITLETKPYSTQQDKTYRISLRGSLSALRFAQKCLFEAGVEVSGGIKTDTIEGTNPGQGNTKYLVLGNTTVTGDLDVKGKAMLGVSMLVADPDKQTLESTVPLDFGNGYKAGRELVKTDEVQTGTLSATGAVTVGGKLTVKNAVSVSGALGVSAKASLSGGADVSDLKITGSVQFPSGNGIIPTEVHDYDASRGETLSSYYGTSRNLFVLIVNADSASHTMTYTSQEAQGAMTRTKTIPVACAGLFYIDGNGNAAPVS